MTTLAVVLGLIMAVVAVAGCFLPVVPGPALSLASLFVLSLARHWQPFSPAFLAVMAGLMVLVMAMDFLVPLIGARRMGASRTGLAGSAVGALAGLVLFPPWGVILGALAGAVAGEFLRRKDLASALRAGWGIFLGNMAAAAFKLAYTLAALFFYIYKML